MAVLNPLELEITNYEEGKEEEVYLEDYPQREENKGERTYYFGKHLLIEKEDFIKEPNPKFYRLYVGAEVRLKGAYIVRCTGFDEDENGNVTKVYCEYLPDTKSGSDCTKKVKGTIHWINPSHADKIEVRLFENLIDESSASDVEGKKNMLLKVTNLIQTVKLFWKTAILKAGLMLTLKKDTNSLEMDISV